MRIVPAVFTRASRSSGSGVAAGTAVGDSAGGADVAAPPVEQAPATSTALTRSARRGEGGGVGCPQRRPPTEKGRPRKEPPPGGGGGGGGGGNRPPPGRGPGGGGTPSPPPLASS